MSKRWRHNQNGPIWHGCASQFSALHARDFFSKIRLRYCCVANDLSLFQTVSKMAIFFVKDYKMDVVSTTHVAVQSGPSCPYDDGWRRAVTGTKIAPSGLRFCPAPQQESPPPVLANWTSRGPKKQARYLRQIAGANGQRQQITGASHSGKGQPRAAQKLINDLQDSRWKIAATSRLVSGHARDLKADENQNINILDKAFTGEVTDADFEHAQKEYENPRQAGENSGRFGNVRRLLLSPKNNGSNNASLPFKRF
jgi:hypothetical protein